MGWCEQKFIALAICQSEKNNFLANLYGHARMKHLVRQQKDIMGNTNTISKKNVVVSKETIEALNRLEREPVAGLCEHGKYSGVDCLLYDAEYQRAANALALLQEKRAAGIKAAKEEETKRLLVRIERAASEYQTWMDDATESNEVKGILDNLEREVFRMAKNETGPYLNDDFKVLAKAYLAVQEALDRGI